MAALKYWVWLTTLPGLTNRSKLARTSATPGKTRLINVYQINNEINFIDLPGYGFAKVSKDEKLSWGKMMQDYFARTEDLCHVFHLVDIRHDPSANDRQMYEWILHNGYEPIIIATKLDKLKRSQVQKNLKAIREGLQLKKGTTVIPYSAETKQGRDEIWELIESLTGGEPSEEA